MRHNLFARLKETAIMFAAAAEVSGAVEVGRRPSPRALKRLGIDPEVFARIGR